MYHSDISEFMHYSEFNFDAVHNSIAAALGRGVSGGRAALGTAALGTAALGTAASGTATSGSAAPVGALCRRQHQ
jgi:hypothetical protein